MEDYLDKVRQILGASSEVPGIAYIGIETVKSLIDYHRQNPQFTYFSEWNDDIMGMRGFVLPHNEQDGKFLKDLLEKGKSIKKATLLSVKNIDDLQVMQKAA